MNGVIQKLEDSVYASKQKAIIHLDKNERLKGLEFIDTLYDAILNKNVLKIEYKSFKARETNYYIIHPQLLKEYNNRWFLITWDEMTYLTLALDRVISIEKINAEYIDKNIDLMNNCPIYGEEFTYRKNITDENKYNLHSQIV